MGQFKTTCQVTKSRRVLWIPIFSATGVERVHLLLLLSTLLTGYRLIGNNCMQKQEPSTLFKNMIMFIAKICICFSGSVVRVSDYRAVGSGFDPRYRRILFFSLERRAIFLLNKCKYIFNETMIFFKLCYIMKNNINL